MPCSLYSASAELLEIVYCFLDFHEIRDSPNLIEHIPCDGSSGLGTSSPVWITPTSQRGGRCGLQPNTLTDCALLISDYSSSCLPIWLHRGLHELTESLYSITNIWSSNGNIQQLTNQFLMRVTSCNTTSPVKPASLSYSTDVNFKLDSKGVETGFAPLRPASWMSSRLYFLLTQDNTLTRPQNFNAQEVLELT